jgi:ActR/RegA family two-component response regulator
VLVTAVRTVRTAVEAMKLGACDYLTKPFAADDLRGSSIARSSAEHSAPEVRARDSSPGTRA